MTNFITFNSISLYLIIYLCALTFKKLDKSFYNLAFVSILTTLAIFNIGDNSVILYHLVFLVTIIKFILYAIKRKSYSSIFPEFYLFPIWCIITIPFSLFYSHIVVMNIDNVYTHVTMNYQQFTQLAYLLIGFLICFMCNYLLNVGKINVKKIITVMDYSYILAQILALSQLILPASFCTNLFRNATNASYTIEGARISGPFSEPSFWGLVCTPFFCKYLYSFFNQFKLKDLICCILFLAVLLKGRSSSAVFGSFVGLFFILFLNLYLRKKIKKKNVVVLVIAIVGIFILLGIFNNSVSNLFWGLLSKLKGEGISGSTRLSMSTYHFSLFLTNPLVFLFGIGYGTVRSSEIISTWACEIGIVGLFLYYSSIFKLCYKLLKTKTELAIELFIMIVVYNSILCISTTEINLLQIWIIYGISFSIVPRKNLNTLKSNLSKNGCEYEYSDKW